MKYFIVLFLSPLLIIGCGGDSSKQVEDLQKSQGFQKKQLEQHAIQLSEMKSVIEDSNNKITTLESNYKKLKLTNTQLHQMIERIRKKSSQQSLPSNVQSTTSRANPALMAAQQRKIIFQIVKSLSNSRKPDAIAHILNQRKLMDSNKQTWTAQSVNLYMRKNSLGSYAQNKK
jgi:septal ring factor EnvC (AmiA/AmiB activator)